MSKVLLVGCGHMGSALLDAWLDIKTYSFSVVDPFNLNELKKKYFKNNIEIFNNIPAVSIKDPSSKTKTPKIFKETYCGSLFFK